MRLSRGIAGKSLEQRRVMQDDRFDASPPSLGTCPKLAESSHVTRFLIRAGSACSKLSSPAFGIGEALSKAYIVVRMLRSWRQPRSLTDAAYIPVRLKISPYGANRGRSAVVRIRPIPVKSASMDG